VHSIYNLFSGCSLITEVPDGFSSAFPNVEYIMGLFDGTAVTSIPSGMFDNMPNLIQVAETFTNCTGITAIPVDLFRYNTQVTYFSRLFVATSITEIPETLFKYNTLVSSFNNPFISCTSLLAIPQDLFRYNINVIQFVGMFQGCAALTEIPEGLFKYNLAASNFQYAFMNCPSLQLNPYIFYEAGSEATRFSGVTNVFFTQCFYRSTFLGIQGIAPDLWNCVPGLGTLDGTQCFGGTGNSLTGLSNYADIPVAWK
jgi:hypothetical protein